MKSNNVRIIFGTAVAAVLIVGLPTAAPAQARAPSFLFSPGYQARLQESRKAYADQWYAQQHQPSATPQPATPRRKKPPAQ